MSTEFLAYLVRFMLELPNEVSDLVCRTCQLRRLEKSVAEHTFQGDHTSRYQIW